MPNGLPKLIAQTRAGSGRTKPHLLRIRGQAAVSAVPRLTSARDEKQEGATKPNRSRFVHSESCGLVPGFELRSNSPRGASSSLWLREATNGSNSSETGRTGRVANPNVLDRLLAALLEPVGREARKRAAEAIGEG
jgi:hypothetical protein